jgi:hypothetical protein
VWNGLAVACRALLFFHPAAWYAVRKMQFDRELACDLAVVSHAPARKGDYAESLIRFARLNLAQEATTWGIDFAASAQGLTARVHSILAGTRRTPVWLRCLRSASAFSLFLLFLGIAPSLAVLLSYTHRPISQSLTEATDTLPQRTAPGARASRKIRSLPFPAHRSPDAAAASSQTEPAQQAEMDTPYPRSENSSSIQSSSGPQLLHRPSASGSTPGNSAKSQTVVLTDTDASGQPVKSGDHDAKQALEQSAATALGLYKQLSTVDHH